MGNMKGSREEPWDPQVFPVTAASSGNSCGAAKNAEHPRLVLFPRQPRGIGGAGIGLGTGTRGSFDAGVDRWPRDPFSPRPGDLTLLERSGICQNSELEKRGRSALPRRGQGGLGVTGRTGSDPGDFPRDGVGMSPGMRGGRDPAGAAPAPGPGPSCST